MFYIVEHDMKVHQIIDTKGKVNKYGKAKLFNTAGDAVRWLSRHYKESSYVIGNSILGLHSNPLYEVLEATPEQLEHWR